MARTHKPRQRSNPENICLRAHKEWERGNTKAAFRLMLEAAKMGDVGAQAGVGYMYDTAVGVKRNRQAALTWYKRAYRRGCAYAAHNIGTVWRDDEVFTRALYWFNRAVAMNGGDDGDASLEIAKLYLYQKQDAAIAMRHLKKVTDSKNVTEDSVEQARRLIKQIKR